MYKDQTFFITYQSEMYILFREIKKLSIHLIQYHFPRVVLYLNIFNENKFSVIRLLRNSNLRDPANISRRGRTSKCSTGTRDGESGETERFGSGSRNPFASTSASSYIRPSYPP